MHLCRAFRLSLPRSRTCWLPILTPLGLVAVIVVLDVNPAHVLPVGTVPAPPSRGLKEIAGTVFSAAATSSPIPVFRSDDQAPCKSNLVVNEFVFDGTSGYCDEAKSILQMPNAGGSSELSESISMQIMFSVFGARGIKTEMEVKYWSDHWKRCDYVTCLPDAKCKTAVSVTRVAFSPHGAHHSKKPRSVIAGRESGLRLLSPVFTPDMAVALFAKKLYGLVVARAGIGDEDGASGIVFDRTVLHVLCRSAHEARVLDKVYHDLLSDELKADIDVIVTVVRSRSGSDEDERLVRSVFSNCA
jgi:hypothetical protein